MVFTFNSQVDWDTCILLSHFRNLGAIAGRVRTTFRELLHFIVATVQAAIAWFKLGAIAPYSTTNFRRFHAGVATLFAWTLLIAGATSVGNDKSVSENAYKQN